MKLKQQTLAGVVVLSVAGDITMAGTPEDSVAGRVRAALIDGERKFLIDLGRVRYVDSNGLGDLVQALAAVRNRGGVMALLNVTRRLNDLLVLARLVTVFECFDTEAGAFRMLNQFQGRAS